MTNKKDKETQEQERIERFVSAQMHLQALIKITMMRDRKSLQAAVRCLRTCRSLFSKLHAASGTVSDIERRIEACESAIGTNDEIQQLWAKLYSFGENCKTQAQYDRNIDALIEDIEAMRESFKKRFFMDSGSSQKPENVIATDRVGHA